MPALLLTLSPRSCSNKIFAYILAAQVAISSLPSPASAIAAACSIASAAAVTSEDLPIHKFRMPKRLSCLASSLLGPLLAYPPAPIAALPSSQLQQQPPPRQPPGNFQQQNMSAEEQAVIQAQLEAFLRRRVPRQPQPQPEDIQRVMDFSGRDRQSCIDALQNNGGDVEAAVNELVQ
jgi:NACalpha-BTF3-like transcription factor